MCARCSRTPRSMRFRLLRAVLQAYIKIYQGEELPHPKSMLQVRELRGGGRSRAVIALDFQ